MVRLDQLSLHYNKGSRTPVWLPLTPPDWTGFKATPSAERFFEVIADYVEQMFRQLSADRVQDTTESVLREHRGDIENMQPLARIELADFVEKYTAKEPTVQQETLSAAVRAMIELEKTRSGGACQEL